MSGSTFRTALGVLVLILLVVLAWGRFSGSGWSIFPAGRTVADPRDQLAQQSPGGPFAGSLAPAPTGPRTGMDAHVHPNAGSGVMVVRDATVVPEYAVSSLRYEARHPFCGGLRPYGAWSVSTGWTLSDWQFCENTAWNTGQANVGVVSYGTVEPVRLVTSTATTTDGITYGTAATTGAVTPLISVNGVTYTGTTGTATTPLTYTGTNGDTDHFTAAVQYQRVGDFDRALERYRMVLQTNDMNAEAHNNVGLLYQTRGMTNEAIGEFQRARSIDRSYAKASNNLGVALMKAGRVGEATTELQRLFREEPRNVDVMTNLALALRTQGRTEEARELLQRALTIDSRDIRVHYNLGVLFEESREIVKAIEHYEAFLSYGGSEQTLLAEVVRRQVQALNAWLLQFQP